MVMRQLIIGLILGIMLGASGMVLAQWGNDPHVQEGFRDFSMEQRLYHGFSQPAPQYSYPPTSAQPFRQPC